MIKLTSVKNIYSRSITRNYTLGFLLLIILISSSLYSIDTHNQDLEQIINKQFIVNSIVKDLTDISRSRRKIMLLILDEDDPFNRDDLIQKYNNQASEFLKIREKIKLLNLSKIQTEMFNKPIKIVAKAYIHQTKTINLANEGDMLKANKIFAEKVLPLKAPIRDSYDGLIHSILRQSKKEIDSAHRTSRDAMIIIIALLALLFVLAMWIQFIATKKLKLAKDESNRANKAKSDFISSMTHELRTPLNAILGFSQILEVQKETLSEDQNSSVQHILEGGHHLLHLIDEVLDLAKIESGVFGCDIKKISLKEIIDQCSRLMNKLAEKQNIQIDFGNPQNYMIMADPQRLKQVLINYISNAIKYNRPNGHVTISYQPVDNNRLRISVSDTGKGIGENDITMLFKPFRRVGDKSANIEGTGIGLVISKKLMSLMNGAVGVSSVVGEGTTFWLEIKLAE